MGNSASIGEKKRLAKKESQIKKKPVHYKLVYFNLRGRAECIRMLLSLGGVTFEDVRVTHEEWPTSSYKTSSPFGQLPVLEIDGSLICQQRAIERHLAKELGLYGETAMDQTKVDVLVECLRDSMATITALYTEKDDAKKMELIQQYVAEGGGPGTLPFFIAYLKKNLVSPWYLGQQISLADVALYTSFEYLLLVVPTVLESEPSLLEWHKRFAKHKPISEWLAKRPVTG